MNLSFAGCGFLGIYHVGVAISFKQYAPHLLMDKISGASAGSLAAVGLLCDLPLAEVTSEMLRVSKEARSHKLGPFSPRFNINTILLQGFEKYLPADAHERVNGKLHVSLTRVYDGKNVIVTHFNSREDLIQALLCACFIPVFSGILPPRFHGVRYMDGGFSDNLPTIDENTVTVSPFCGESDICPRDKSSQLFHIHFSNTSIELSKQNINRFSYVLLPPKGEVLGQICQQGFEDGLRFLQRNNLINCNRCVSIQSSFVLQETVPAEVEDYDPECKDCTAHRKVASKANLPDTVVHVLQSAIESANKGLINWLFRFRTSPILSAMCGSEESNTKLDPQDQPGYATTMIKWLRVLIMANPVFNALLGRETSTLDVAGEELVRNSPPSLDKSSCRLIELNLQRAIDGIKSTSG